jgi:hypothetical protein
VERDSELAGAEVGAEVAADLADHVDDVGAELLREPLQLVLVELLQVLRGLDALQEALVAVACGLVAHSCLMKM